MTKNFIKYDIIGTIIGVIIFVFTKNYFWLVLFSSMLIVDMLARSFEK